jgi:hypothetical protein
MKGNKFEVKRDRKKEKLSTKIVDMSSEVAEGEWLGN